MVAAASLDELLTALRMLDGRSDSVIGAAPVDLLAHSLQCAALLAGEGASDELVVAGLFHDIGHGIAPGRQADHGRTGAAYVRPVLGADVARLIGLHVPAKGYLVATDPGYAGTLSPGSAASLELQGGPASVDAVATFAADPLAAAALQLRRADDAAKRPGVVVPTVERWEPIIRRVATAPDR